MQFPKPIGYYSIDLPEEVQEQIQGMKPRELKSLLSDIAYKVEQLEEPFDSNDFDSVTNEVIEDQLTCTNDWLSFMQWVLEGLKQAVN